MRSVRSLALVCLVFWPSAAGAQTPDNVLVVANTNSRASVEIAEYYVKRRQVPTENLLAIKTSTADQVTRLEFDATIQGPIAAWLQQHSAQDRILFIVLTKGVPLRIAGSGGRTGTISSVDSELTLLYRRLAGKRVDPSGSVPNPYYLGDAAASKAQRFSHARHDIYLVTRLDGFTVEDVKALVDRALVPAMTGRIVLDQREALSEKPNDWLAEAAKRLEAAGHSDRVVLEQTSQVVENAKGILGYYSWGSNDSSMRARHPAIEFVPGALASMFVSSDARTFDEPPADWRPGGWESRQAYFAGSPQSLTGDLIRAGITGVAGYVAEPFLDSSVRPEILFPAYLGGYSLAEAFYLALPALSWQSVVIGDPLCAPFSRSPIPAAELTSPLDKETELPAYFSARRLAADDLKGRPGAKLIARSEARLAKNDQTGAREALEEAVKVDPSSVQAWRTLGALYDAVNDHTRAIAAYRMVIDSDPRDPVALNNLAYALAVHDNNPKEALPLAERALQLAPKNPLIEDTVGWIKYLLGDHPGAVKILEPLARILPRNAEVQLHAAAAFAAVGRLDAAAAALKAAEAANADITTRPEFEQVKKKIGK
jgi:uncharacterized protein (TIGR03790 family)